MQSRLILFLAVSLLLLSAANADMQVPPCIDVENPAHYTTLTTEHPLFARLDFGNKSVVVGCRREGWPVPVTVAGSSGEYTVEATLHFDGELLMNEEELIPFADLTRRIASFEAQPVAIAFPDAERTIRNGVIELVAGQERLTYDLVEERLMTVLSSTPALIALLPQLTTLTGTPAYQEFKEKRGIRSVELGAERLHVCDVASIATGPWLMIDASGDVGAFILPNNVVWDSIPEIADTHRILEEHLPEGCAVGRDEQSYTAMGWRLPGDHFTIRAIVVCPSGRKEMAVRFLGDGSHETPTIYMDYSPRRPGAWRRFLDWLAHLF